MLLWDVFLANTTSYTRSRLCLCNCWFRDNAIEASITHILANVRDARKLAVLEQYSGTSVVHYPADFHLRLRDVFMNNRDAGRPDWVISYSYSDYHMFARHSPAVTEQAFIHGDDDVCRVILAVVKNIPIHRRDYLLLSAVQSLASRSKRELAMQAYDACCNPQRGQMLLFGGIISRDQALIDASECNARFVALRAACVLGDDKLVQKYLTDDQLEGHIFNVEEVGYAIIGGNLDTVKYFLQTTHLSSHTMYCTAMDMYYRTRNSRYLDIIGLLGTRQAPNTGATNGMWKHIDLPLVNKLIEVGYNVDMYAVAAAVRSSTFDVVQRLMMLNAGTLDVINIAAARDTAVIKVVIECVKKVRELTKEELLPAISMAADAGNVENVILLAGYLAELKKNS